LDKLSQHIAEDSALSTSFPLRIIALGGYISVTFFHSRSSTGDLDFFFPGIIQSDGTYVIPAGFDASLEYHIRSAAFNIGLLPEWANNAVSNFIEGHPQENEIIDGSISQGVILYASPQLKIYAAKWSFQLVQKLVAIKYRNIPYDKTDAAYIAQLIRQERQRPPRKSELEAEWQAMQATTDDCIMKVNETSCKLFGYDVIVID
jgi:hypothetical protein